MTNHRESPIPERYEILENLVEDEVEVLYRCRDTTLGREVLCKLPGIALAEHSGTDDKRALREARSLAQVMHSGIQRLLDVVEIPGGPLLALEPVPGESLKDRLARDGRMSSEEVCQLGIELADALSAVHAIGAVHRDLAPQHVVLRPDGTACLTGFQLVKFTSDSGEMSSIAYVAQPVPAGDEGRRKLLPTYPAPEQFGGEVANPRTDVFGLGSLLYRCLTGEDAIPGLLDRGWQPPKDPARVVPGVSKALGKAIVSCLARSPVGRTQTAAALRDALEAVRGPKVAAGAGGGKSNARWFGLAAGLAAAGLLVFLGPWFRPADAHGDGSRGRVVPENQGAQGPARGSIYEPFYTKSYALLIGIDAYRGTGWESLKAPVGDVQSIEARLKNLPGDWKVKTLLNEEASRTRIITELENLERDTGLDDQVLIFFAGHGQKPPAVGKSGWIVPADAESGVNSSLVPFFEFVNFFERSKAKHILVAMDCCHSGRIANKTRSGPKPFEERFLVEEAHIIMTSGRGDQEVHDSFENGHSPFASAFLNALAVEGVRTTTSTQFYADVLRWYERHDIVQTPMMCPATPGDLGQYVFILTE